MSPVSDPLTRKLQLQFLGWLQKLQATAAAPGAARIQRRRAAGWRMPPGAVYVGRPSIWGNPFGHRDPAIAARMYRAWLVGSVRSAAMLDCRVAVPTGALPLAERRRQVLHHLPTLRGRPLACWCRPGAPCHGDVLLQLANAEAAADA